MNDSERPRMLDQLSVAELKGLLRGLDVAAQTFVEKKEFVEAAQTRLESVSAKELRQRLESRGVAVPPGSEKHELITLLASTKSSTAAVPAQAQAARAVAVDLSRYSDEELKLLAGDRGVAVAGMGRNEMIEAIEKAASSTVRCTSQSAAVTEFVRNWMGAHAKFRSMTSMLEEQGKQAVAKGAAVEQSVLDKICSDIDVVEANLAGHGSWEERSLFAFFKREFASFAQYDRSLESQHERAHKLAGEIQSHLQVFKSRRDVPRLDRIASLLREYNSDMSEHLTLEEVGVLSLLNNMTPQQTCSFERTVAEVGEKKGGREKESGCCGGGSQQCAPKQQQKSACGPSNCGNGSCC